MSADLARASANIRRWKEDPVAFVREVLGAEPDNWQAEFLMAFTKHQRLALQACKGPGKTTVLSWCAWNFLCTRMHPKIAATSINFDNLSDGLWTEMALWKARSKAARFPLADQAFEWTKTRIFSKDHPETWFMSARSWSKSSDKSQQANTLAGLHADSMMFIIDESGGVPDSVAAAAEAGLTSGNDTRLLQAGNPTHREGPLYRAATSERHLWFLIEITGDPDDPNRASRVSKQWAQEQIEKFGRDNPWVIVNVFGKFPPSSLNVLLGPDEVSAATRRKHGIDTFGWAQKRIGVDCARFGDDRTVLFPRQGLMAFKPVEMRNARTNEIAARVALAKWKWKSEMEFVDDTGGFGAGVIDSLIQAGHSPQPINFSSRPTDPRYLNKRAEMWFLMAEWIKRGGSIPNMPELVRELTAPTYTFKNGKLQLEGKDQIKDRLGYSPDLADALCLTFAMADMPAMGQGIPDFEERKQTKHEYDPLKDW